MITNSIQIPGVTPAVINAIPDEQFWARVATLPAIDRQRAVLARLNIETAKAEAKCAHLKERLAQVEALSAKHLGVSEAVMRDARARGV